MRLVRETPIPHIVIQIAVSFGILAVALLLGLIGGCCKDCN